MAVEFFDFTVKNFDPTATDEAIAEANDNIRENKNGNYLNSVSFYYFKGDKELFVDSKIDGFYESGKTK